MLDGNGLCDQFGLRRVGVLKSRHSLSIDSSRCGVGCETLDRDLFDPGPVFPQMGELGVKWARLQTGWAKCERTKGEYNFTWLDEQVDSLISHGVQPWFCVSYGNPVYTTAAAEGYQAAVGQVPLGDVETEQAWVNYVEALVTHFKGRVTYYEIWNEPDIAAFWRNLPSTGATYARLFDLTAPSIKEVYPEAKIVAIGMTGRALTPTGLAWVREFFQSTKDPGIIDVLTFHSYGYPPDRDYEEEVRRLQATVAEFNPRIELWQGESGYPSIPSGAGARAYCNETSETIQAKWLSRHVLCNLDIGIGLVSWHQAIDLIGYRDPKMVNPKGLLRGSDASRKPSFYAYQRICSLFTGSVQPVLRRWGAQSLGSTRGHKVPGVKAYHFASTIGDMLVAYWQEGTFGESLVHKPIRMQLEGDWGEALLVDLLSGNVYEVDGEATDAGYDFTLPLADYGLVLCAPAACDSVLLVSRHP
jgi:hypothetical protein